MSKEFSWSFSKLDGFETCPKRYYEINVSRSVKEDKEEDVGFGMRAHNAFKDVLTGKAKDMPDDMIPFRKWVAWVNKMPGRKLIEHKFALTRGLEPTIWMGHDTWWRGIGDVVAIAPPIAITVDWKSGKVKPNSPQLAITAQAVLSHFPEVQAVGTSFVWLAHGTKTEINYRRGKMANVWGDLFPRVDKLERAYKTLDFPPNPGGLCKRHCPVKSCPFWGKGTR